MLTNFTQFVWNWKWLIRSQSQTPSGDYTVTGNDYRLTNTGSTSVTYTLPVPSNSGQVLKIKNKGSTNITINGTIFLDVAVTSLILGTGDMVTLTDDGTYWSVGD